jgi:hypothetical protein
VTRARPTWGCHNGELACEGPAAIGAGCESNGDRSCHFGFDRRYDSGHDNG